MALSPILMPVAQAGTFPFVDAILNKITAVSNAQGTELNSQNMTLLKASVNFDPNPAIGGGGIDLTGDGTALEPQNSPSGTSADTTNVPASSQISVYTVRSGDSIGSVAKMFGVTTNTILWANDIKGGVIHAGDMLVILPVTGIQHKVASGETLDSLATTYKSTAENISTYNNIADNSALVVGQTIIIPNGQIPPTAAQIAVSNQKKSISKIKSGASTEPYLGGGGAPIPGYFSWPLVGGIITQGLHGWNGVDIGAKTGTSILAAADGTVIISKGGGGWNGGYGNYVVIQHSNGTQTLYAHMSRISSTITIGTQVSQGQTIGYVGMTGLATGPHLHFEVHGAENPFAN